MRFPSLGPSGVALAAAVMLLPAVSGCRSVDGTLAGVGARNGDFAVAPAARHVPAAAPSAAPRQTAPVALAAPSQTSGAVAANPAQDEAMRKQRAVDEIRAKAANSVASGAQPQVGAVPVAAATQLTPEEQEALRQEMALEARLAQGEISDEELQAKQESIRRLRARAGSHYNQALKNIEN